MYTVDSKDHVTTVAGVPQPSPGAPLPVVLATDQALVIAYLVKTVYASWDGANPRGVDHAIPDERAAVVEFVRPCAHQFGPPNDEAFSGHPLAARGLRPYGVFEVTNSSWVRSLEQMNRVHERHDPERFRQLRHFVFAFHDSTFECIAADFVVAGVHAGSVASVIPRMLQGARLGERRP
jgi:hypothetical protein